MFGAMFGKGDLGKEITTEILGKHFQQFKSFAKAKVVRSKVENKARGYGNAKRHYLRDASGLYISVSVVVTFHFRMGYVDGR